MAISCAMHSVLHFYSSSLHGIHAKGSNSWNKSKVWKTRKPSETLESYHKCSKQNNSKKTRNGSSQVRWQKNKKQWGDDSWAGLRSQDIEERYEQAVRVSERSYRQAFNRLEETLIIYDWCERKSRIYIGKTQDDREKSEWQSISQSSWIRFWKC